MRLIDKFFDNKTKTEVTYYEDGNKETEIHYKNGKKDGLWIDHYDNGQKEREEDYNNGVEDGVSTTWFESGQKRGEEH